MRRRSARSPTRPADTHEVVHDTAGARGRDGAHCRGAQHAVHARVFLAASGRWPVPQHSREEQPAPATAFARATATWRFARPARRIADARRASFAVGVVTAAPQLGHAAGLLAVFTAVCRTDREGPPNTNTLGARTFLAQPWRPPWWFRDRAIVANLGHGRGVAAGVKSRFSTTPFVAIENRRSDPMCAAAVHGTCLRSPSSADNLSAHAGISG